MSTNLDEKTDNSCFCRCSTFTRLILYYMVLIDYIILHGDNMKRKKYNKSDISDLKKKKLT